ncbi:T9SS type A sorting domain-containing protein [Portibacter lacus]|uniref:HYR domain-containing protein n=1 Tax=Portibacter lacus TaxID=1099794 RepID=A0AA37WE07_9BACT|nr:T9SS type A sorting domain-containing protein [Portibacter lacus]GLR18446.1 hypothetical protein GCM10007940_30620 [Portibacter lacus]
MSKTFLKGWIYSLLMITAINSFGQVTNTCNTTFYDTGGPTGNYENNEDYLVTYCADNGGKMRSLFKKFSLSTESIPDTLFVYDGPSTFSPLISKYSGSMATPGEEYTINSLIRGNGACLTFEFKSGGSGTSTGWEAEIYCLAPPQGGIEICGDGIDNDADGLIDQADPDCLIEPSVENCFTGNYYYIPPIWQLNTPNDNELNGPASLNFSTRYPSANINVRTLDNSYNQDFTISSAAALTQAIPLTYLQTENPNTKESNKGFIVSSDVPIDIKYLTDGSLNKNHISIRGREGLGRGFRVGSQTNTRIASSTTSALKEAHFISVMASEDDTDVTFTFDIPVTGLTSPHTVRLNRGESYLIKDDDNNVSVSGALVSATKNIAVISGSQYTQAYGTLAQDGGMDQIIPASKAGINYVLTRSGNDVDQDYAIVVPIENGTNIFLDGAFIQTATIDAGDYYQIPLNGSIGEPLYIRTSRPAMVYHVSGQSGGNVGMSVVPPIGSCRGDNILTFSKLTNANNHLLNIIIPTAGLSNLRLNGNPVGGIVRNILGFSGYSSVLLQESDLSNDNTLTADVNFTAGFIGSSANASVYSYLTSYRETIDFLDVVTGLPIEYIDLDTICNTGSFDYTFQVESCGTGHRLISIEESGMMGTAEITDSLGLSIHFESNGENTGQNFISVVVENNLGNRSSICVGFIVDDLQLDLGDNVGTCLVSNFTLTPEVLTGGEPPYTYLWSNGATSETIEVSPSTTTRYYLTVTDQRGCTYVDDINVNIGAGPQISCKGQINISLNELCESEITPEVLLLNDQGIEQEFTVKVEDQYGFVIPNAVINDYYIGKTLKYTVTTACDNACWGNLTVQDNFIPIINCGSYDVLCSDDISPDSVGYPVPFDNAIDLGENRFRLSGVDACSDVTLSYNETAVIQACTSNLEKIIYRNWLVVDESGNQNSCTDTINVIKEDINNIIFPLNRDDIDLPSLACDSNYPTFENGHPSTDPEAGGGLYLTGCKSIDVAFEDTYLEGCGTSFKVLRHWKLFDWCTGLNREEYQVIKVTDKEPPTFVCPAPLTVYTSPYDCETGQIIIPPPTMQDNCNETGFTVKVNITENDVFGHFVSENNVVNGLPLGINTVDYYMFDACDNRDTCSTIITVQDDKAPFAIADLHTVASIGSDGTARIYAENFDDGSFDNCGIKLMKVRKKVDSCGSEPGDYLFDGLYYNDYVDYCCAEVGLEHRVQFLVEDIHGNVNMVWVEVTLNDKLPPVVSAPPHITISCDHDFLYDDLSYFGDVVIGDEPRKPIILNDAYNSGTVGLDGYAVDNCYVEVEETSEIDLECGAGTITRTFTATDNNGMTDVATQVITIKVADPFTYEQIIWPEKVTIEGCVNVDIDTSVTGSPRYIDKNCAKLAAEYTDKVFEYGDGACLSIHREWQVNDWCQYNPLTGEGLWTYIQVIYVENNTKPTYDYDYQDTTVCISGSCEGIVDLQVDATDDCTSELFYKWRVDFDLDGIYDDEGIGNRIQEVWEPGRYYIVWSVQDHCGNTAIKKYYVTVQDCKPPTPYCLSGISTAVMPLNGEVQLWASDYNKGSFDNCTADLDLKLSFSKDTSDTFFTVTCEMMGNGVQQTIPLKVWVTDEAGNQDYCSVEIRVNDTNDVCPDVENGYVDIGGNIYTADLQRTMRDVEVTLESNSDLREMQFTEEDGSFRFSNIPDYLSYTVRPIYDENYRLGVTTLDIILIQKHILGLKIFTDPYKVIAADASNSESISGLDLILIRKLILGLTDTYPKNSSWRFVDKNYVFNDVLKPWGFDETIDLGLLSESNYNADLIGIKIGDVNDSYSGLENSNTTVRSEAIYLETDNKQFAKGDVMHVNLEVSEEMSIEGFQFAVNYDKVKLDLLAVDGAGVPLKEDNINHASEEGLIGISFDDISGIDIAEGTSLIQLKFIAKENSGVEESIELNTSRMSAELYTINSEVKPIELHYRSVEKESRGAITVYQNEPNPFVKQTRIPFELSSSRSVSCQIFDIDGKLVQELKSDFGIGNHEFRIGSENLKESGVYYYKITSEDFQITKKMIFTR